MPKTTAVTKRITTSKYYSYNIQNYDTDNLYPQRTADIINSSISTYNAIKTFKKFIFGGGYNDVLLSSQVINDKGQTFDQFLRKVSEEFVKYGGYSVLFNYNALYQFTNIQIMPFEYCRLGKLQEDLTVKQIAVCKDWTFVNTKQIDYYDVFNPSPEVIEAQVEAAGGWDKYKGQILYYGMDGDMVYPLAHFESVREDAITETVIKSGKNHNISTNFLASTIIIVPFEFKDKTPYPDDEDGNLYFDEWVKSLSDFQGFDKSGKFIILENNIKDENGKSVPIDIKTLDIQNYDQLYKYTEESVANNVRKAFLIPPILLDTVSTGFSTEIMQAAYSYYNNVTYDYRLIFEELTKMIVENYERQLSTTNDFSIKPLNYNL